MEEIKCEQVGLLSGEKWEKMHDISRRVYSPKGLSPTLHTCGGGNLEPKIMEEPMVWDGFNQNIRQDSSVIGTLTRNCGADLKRNGQGIIEPIAFDEQNKCLRQDGTVETLTTDGSSPKHNNKIIEPTERFYQQAFETFDNNDCEDGDTIDAYNKKVNKSGISPTVTTMPEGFKTAILSIKNCRIRKLTPCECWRLMDFDDNDFYRAAYGRDIPLELAKRVEKRDLKKEEWKILWKHERHQKVSNSQLYKQAGNSIVVSVLESIFKQML